MKRFIHRRIAWASIVCVACVCLCAVADASTNYTGVVVLDQKPDARQFDLAEAFIWSEERTDPRPLRIHYLIVKVGSSCVELSTSASPDPDESGIFETTLTQPEDLMVQANFLAGVNASAFQNPKNPKDHKWSEGKPVDILGCVASESKMISPCEPHRTVFWIDGERQPHIGVPPQGQEMLLAVADWLHPKGKKSGRLLKESSNVANEDGGKHPRTAIGFDEEKTWVVMAVVDGREKGVSEGVTLPELAEIMKSAGCSDAINLDGGGSSILLHQSEGVMTTINKPSSRKHRPVAVMVGVRKREGEQRVAEDLKRGLVAHWDFDEKGGDELIDHSGFGRNGVLLNELSLLNDRVSGVKGTALRFDGIDDGVGFPSISVADSITVSVWGKIDPPLLAGHLVSNHPGWFLSGYVDGHMRFVVQTERSEVSVVFAEAEFLGEGWHHYVGVYDGRSVDTYLDGKLSNTAPLTGAIKRGKGSRIGRYWSGSTPKYQWKGAIDEVRIYDRALTPEEVVELNQKIEKNID